MTIKSSVGIALFFLVFLTACSYSGQSIIANREVASQPEPLAQMSAPGIERSIVPVIGDIYRFFNNNHSSLFLVTDDGVLFIDPLNVAAAEWVNGEIERIFGKEVTHVLYSHAHEDHASGAAKFGEVEIISHANSIDVMTPPADQTLIRAYAGYDKNSDDVIQRSEADGDLINEFAIIDINNDGLLTGQETETYFNRNIIPPTQTYESAVHSIELGGKTVEMHFVGGNHAADMSYIFFPEESLVFYVDVISLRAIPFGPLSWYSKEDTENTFAVALSIDADIAVPSHGPIGTQDDVRDLQQYMNDLRQAVITKIDEGLSLEEIQTSVSMQDYADFDFYEQRLPLNIQGMYRVLIEERAAN